MSRPAPFINPQISEDEKLGAKALDKYGPGGLAGDLNQASYGLKAGILKMPFSQDVMGQQFKPGVGVPNNAPMNEDEASYAKGGVIKGPGTGTSDSIPSKEPIGGAIIPAAVVKLKGIGFFDKLEAAAPQAKGAKEKVSAKVSNGEYRLSPEAVKYWGAGFIKELIGSDAENPAEDAVPGEEAAEMEGFANGGIVNPRQSTAEFWQNAPQNPVPTPGRANPANPADLMKDRLATSGANLQAQSADLRQTMNNNLANQAPRPVEAIAPRPAAVSAISAMPRALAANGIDAGTVGNAAHDLVTNYDYQHPEYKAKLGAMFPKPGYAEGGVVRRYANGEDYVEPNLFDKAYSLAKPGMVSSDKQISNAYNAVKNTIGLGGPSPNENTDTPKTMQPAIAKLGYEPTADGMGRPRTFQDVTANRMDNENRNAWITQNAKNADVQATQQEQQQQGLAATQRNNYLADRGKLMEQNLDYNRMQSARAANQQANGQPITSRELYSEATVDPERNFDKKLGLEYAQLDNQRNITKNNRDLGFASNNTAQFGAETGRIGAINQNNQATNRLDLDKTTQAGQQHVAEQNANTNTAAQLEAVRNNKFQNVVSGQHQNLAEQVQADSESHLDDPKQDPWYFSQDAQKQRARNHRASNLNEAYKALGVGYADGGIVKDKSDDNAVMQGLKGVIGKIAPDDSIAGKFANSRYNGNEPDNKVMAGLKGVITSIAPKNSIAGKFATNRYADGGVIQSSAETPENPPKLVAIQQPMTRDQLEEAKYRLNVRKQDFKEQKLGDSAITEPTAIGDTAMQQKDTTAIPQHHQIALSATNILSNPGNYAKDKVDMAKRYSLTDEYKAWQQSNNPVK